MNFVTSKYSINFPNIEENIDKIIEIMNEYDYYDLLISIYCINLCVNNRSLLTSQLQLNLGLKLCEKKGIIRIKTYKEFKELFLRLKPYIDVDMYDDPILEDFGQVKFKFNDEVYNVIIGTGYNSTYAQLFFLESLSKITKTTDIVTKVLNYSSDNIDYFMNANTPDGKKNIRLVIPSNKLFRSVKKYFSELDFELTKEINEIIKSNNSYIEKEHFVLYDNKFYPLYNTSILIDMFDKIYNKLELPEKNLIVENGILNLLAMLSIIDQGQNPYLYFPIKLFNNISERDANSYTFFARTSKGSSIIAINKSKFNSEEEVEKEIDKITLLAEKNDLKLIELRERSSEGLHGITITNKSNLKFILYDNYINISEPNYILGEKNKSNILECTALDVIYMLLFSENIDEIEEFIDYNDQDEYEQIIGFGGDSCRFLTWKSMDHMIAKGAIKYGMINLDINTSDGYVLDYFEETINQFPWKSSNDYLFDNPFAWIIEKETDQIYLYRNKINPTFFGYVIYFGNNQLCFFSQNLMFWDKNNIDKYKEITALVDDITLRKLKTCYEYIQNLSIASNKSLYFLYMPIEYAKKVGINTKDESKIVYSDYYEDDLSLNIRYTVNYQLLYTEISKVDDRQVENKYIKELFEPLIKDYPQEILEFINYLNDTKKEKKEIEVVQIPLDYMYKNSFGKYKIETSYFLKVKKEIAKVCLKNNISSGEYYGKDATNLIRKMQKELIDTFEKEISKYNLLDLHIKLLEMYSNCYHEVYIHQKRYTSINNVTEDVLEDVRNRIIEQRETAKRNSRTLLYLIESNLFLKREQENIIKEDELQFILAFSHWLVNLNDTADICYFTENEAHITVNHEYVVDNIEDNNEINAIDYTKRIYSKNTYSIANDSEDNSYLELIKETFNKETGGNLIGLFDICDYLQMRFLDFEYEILDSNVYKIKKDSLIQNLVDIVNNSDGEKYSIQEIQNNLKLLTIIPENLKIWKGKQDFFIPFNERENRDNRFEIKPLLVIDEDIIFSPPLIKNVHSLWFNGILNFMLPYEIGLPETRKTIMKWKKRYEVKMVYDIKSIFENNEITFVRINVQLHKIDKAENYSRDIGDYDVIAIDDIKKNIWIIESKFLSKVGSFYEMFDQQRNFFKENKYIEKFQRRIDYMNDNYKRILKSYGFYDVSGYKIVPYMVFNKVMISRYRKIDFQLISIMELEEEINKYKHNI